MITPDDLAALTPTLASLGWDDDLERWAEATRSGLASNSEEPDDTSDGPEDSHQKAAPETIRGRLARVSRGFSVVFTGGDAVLAASSSARVDLDDEPATGDFVLITDDPADGPAIAAVAPRRSALSRRAPGRVPTPQVLAANIDVVLIMHGLDREINLRRLERQLVVSWDSGAQPVIVLTKSDMISRAADPASAAQAVDELIAQVQTIAPGVEVVAVSTTEGVGLSQVSEFFRPNRTAALLGLSGVGKSTLVNAISNGMVQLTGEVRANDRRGRHTTVTRDLIPLPDGGFMIDTPGVREIGLWQAERGMELTFPEIAAAAARCRFGNCEHDQEPGCEVQAGLANGSIPQRRVDHWRDLVAELELQNTQLTDFARRSESRDRADAEDARDNVRSNKRSKKRSGSSRSRGRSGKQSGGGPKHHRR